MSDKILSQSITAAPAGWYSYGEDGEGETYHNSVAFWVTEITEHTYRNRIGDPVSKPRTFNYHYGVVGPGLDNASEVFGHAGYEFCNYCATHDTRCTKHENAGG